MKGKIVEALRHGVPVVTTVVGAEGIGVVNGQEAIVAEDSAALAKAALNLLHDAELCASMSTKGAELIRRRFSRAAARESLNSVFHTPLCGLRIDPSEGFRARD